MERVRKFLLDLNGFENLRLLWINRLIVILAFIFTFREQNARALILVIFVLWLSTIKFDEIIKVIKIPVFKWLGLLVLMIGVSYFYSEYESSYSIKYFNRFSIYLVIPMIMIYTSLRQDYIKYVINAFILSMLINEIISYGILFGWWLELKDGYPVYFMHHVFYSILLSFTVMLLIYKFVNLSNIMVKTVSFIFILTMIGNLIISGGRSGQIALVLAFILTMMIFFKTRIRTTIIIFSLPIIIFLLAYNIYPEFKQRAEMTVSDTYECTEKGNYNSSFGARLAGYVLTAKMVENASILDLTVGYGVGDLNIKKKDTIEKYFNKVMKYQYNSKHFHNSYLDVFGWLGFIGLLFLLMFLISIYRINIQDDQLRYIKLSIFSILLISYFPDTTFDQQSIMLLTSIFVSILLVREKYEKSLIA